MQSLGWCACYDMKHGQCYMVHTFMSQHNTIVSRIKIYLLFLHCGQKWRPVTLGRLNDDVTEGHGIVSEVIVEQMHDIIAEVGHDVMIYI